MEEGIRKWMWRLTALFSVSMMVGCAEWFEPPSGSLTVTSASPLVLRTFVSDTEGGGGRLTGGSIQSAAGSARDIPSEELTGIVPTPLMAAATEKSFSERQSPPAPEQTNSIEDELYDPFQKPGEQPVEVEEYDPWEPFNLRMFNFNYKLDKYLIKPVAEFYDKVMPDEIESALSRGFRNLSVISRTVNSLLQGKFKRAGIEVARFLINSSLGIGGLLDFAKEGLFLDAPPPEDTGQTLGFYGVKPGPYLVLPLLPQVFTIRDGVGYVVDLALNPMVYFLPFTTLFPMNVGYILNERSINLENFQGVEDATVDLYGAVRNAYLQRRAQSIRE